MSSPRGPLQIPIVLWFAIWIHVLYGIWTLLIIFPFINNGHRKTHIQQWSSRLLRIFGIELQIINSHVLPSGSYLLSSNHISWMDIHAINAYRPIRFVAKSEVEKWPIFGWMAKQLGTVFIKRNSAKHAHLVVNEMSRVLKYESICIFPEGTSTNGESVLPFKPNLFESAIATDIPICSVAIRYRSKITGQRSEAPAFIGDMGLLESMSKILKNRNLVAELTFFPPFKASSLYPGDRKMLAFQSYEQISLFLNPP
jgi:1-acyl-sn-glycerol-3-phosphate acyltransferase